MFWNKECYQTFTVYRTTTPCFSRTERRHIVHATLWLTCAQMCRSSLNWPPNSPDLAPVDYAVWGALQQMVYRRKISNFNIDQLKRVLIDCWAQISQDTLNRAIDQLPKRLMMVIKAKGAHVEFRLD